MTISEFYKEVRAFSERLCLTLNIEDYIPQPVDFVSPPKWHLAHTTWFFEQFILEVHLEDYKLFHEKYSYLFNSYYNHVGDRSIRANRGVITRPTVAEVYEYRKYVDEHMLQLLDRNLDSSVHKFIVLGLNHEQQHQELLITDLKYTFSLNPLLPVYNEDKILVNDRSEQFGYLKVASGVYEIGVEHGSEGFFYDNEYNRHKVFLDEFEISKALVTNREYLEFVEDGQYEKFNHWHDEGHAWIVANGVQKPIYWQKLNNKWFQYSLGGLVELDMEASLAHISFYEASAFASWKGMRLPSEAEWEVASDKLDWGSRWEWTQSAYLPYPDFQIAEGAIGEYNGKFMINQKVLRGSSKATSPGHSRNTYRNFFHPHHQWQLTGIRIVK